MFRQVKDRVAKVGYDFLGDLLYRHWWVPMLTAPLPPRRLSWQTRLVLKVCGLGRDHKKHGYPLRGPEGIN